MNKKLLLIVLGLLCAAVVAGAGWFLLAPRPTAPQPEDNGVDWVGPQEEYTGSVQSGGSIAIPGMDAMNFKAGEKKQAVNLYNPAENSCFFQISLLLADGTRLYQSNLIVPGKGLYEIELLTALPEGVFEDAVLKYECFSMDADCTPLNGAELTLTIHSLP